MTQTAHQIEAHAVGLHHLRTSVQQLEASEAGNRGRSRSPATSRSRSPSPEPLSGQSSSSALAGMHRGRQMVAEAERRSRSASHSPPSHSPSRSPPHSPSHALQSVLKQMRSTSPGRGLSTAPGVCPTPAVGRVSAGASVSTAAAQHGAHRQASTSFGGFAPTQSTGAAKMAETEAGRGLLRLVSPSPSRSPSPSPRASPSRRSQIAASTAALRAAIASSSGSTNNASRGASIVIPTATASISRGGVRSGGATREEQHQPASRPAEALPRPTQVPAKMPDQTSTARTFNKEESQQPVPPAGKLQSSVTPVLDPVPAPAPPPAPAAQPAPAPVPESMPAPAKGNTDASRKQTTTKEKLPTKPVLGGGTAAAAAFEALRSRGESERAEAKAKLRAAGDRDALLSATIRDQLAALADKDAIIQVRHIAK